MVSVIYYDLCILLCHLYNSTMVAIKLPPMKKHNKKNEKNSIIKIVNNNNNILISIFK